MQQMEEVKSRKAEEAKRKKDEELREEERLKRERDEIEERYNKEKNDKQRKFKELQEANAEMIKGKVISSPIVNVSKEAKVGTPVDLIGSGPQNLTKNQDLFGNGPLV